MVFLRAGSLRTQIWTQIWIQICVRLISFVFYSIHPISSWNPHVWGEILRFLGKSLGKSSDCADFINPWTYQIYLSNHNFLIVHLHILKFSDSDFEVKSWDLFLCVLHDLPLFILREFTLWVKYECNLNSNFLNLNAQKSWFDHLWSSCDLNRPAHEYLLISNSINCHFLAQVNS